MSKRSFFDTSVQTHTALCIEDAIDSDDGHAVILSMMGESSHLFSLISDAIEQGHWDPSAVLAIGFRYDESQDLTIGHLLIIATKDGYDLSVLGASVPAIAFVYLQQKGFFYAHLLGALAEHVNIGAFDKGFELMFNSDRVFEDLFSTLFSKAGTERTLRSLRGSKTQATSLILLGKTDKRVVVAGKADVRDSFMRIPTPTSGPARYATIDETAFAAAPLGGDRLFALHVTQISQLLDDEIKTLTWRDTQIVHGNVVELAIVDGEQGKLLLTLDGAFRYMPVDVRFTRGKLKLKADVKHCTPATSDQPQPPIVRFNAQGSGGRGYIAHVDPGSDALVVFSTIDQTAQSQPAFIRTITGVTNGGWGVIVDV